VHGIINLIANHQIIVAGRHGFARFVIRLSGGFPVLLVADVLLAKVASLIKTTATLVKVQLILVKRLNVTKEHVLRNAPILDELDKGYLGTIAERPYQQPQ
jgi:hypothetical protein